MKGITILNVLPLGYSSECVLSAFFFIVFLYTAAHFLLDFERHFFILLIVEWFVHFHSTLIILPPPSSTEGGFFMFQHLFVPFTHASVPGIAVKCPGRPLTASPCDANSIINKLYQNKIKAVVGPFY